MNFRRDKNDKRTKQKLPDPAVDPNTFAGEKGCGVPLDKSHEKKSKRKKHHPNGSPQDYHWNSNAVH